MTSNGFKIFGVFDGESDHANNPMLGALPHPNND